MEWMPAAFLSYAIARDVTNADYALGHCLVNLILVFSVAVHACFFLVEVRGSVRILLWCAKDYYILWFRVNWWFLKGFLDFNYSWVLWIGPDLFLIRNFGANRARSDSALLWCLGFGVWGLEWRAALGPGQN
jgi:hypothetical protein